MNRVISSKFDSILQNASLLDGVSHERSLEAYSSKTLNVIIIPLDLDPFMIFL
jgi:hypothetical protein